MTVFRLCLLALLVCITTFSPAQTPASAPANPSEEDKPIEDNSFLVEEAYNQERGVVQHIHGFTKMATSRDWGFTFTQEWPVNPAPKHQLSYTIHGLRVEGGPEGGAGFGDLLLNWRYQVVRTDRFAFAPRVSFLAPTGNHQQGRGAGGAGVQFNLPFSAMLHRRLASHWNAGATLIPNAKNPAGDKAALQGYNVGASLIFLAHPRFNLMLETVLDSSEEVMGPKVTQRTHTAVVSPGFRWAHNFASGLQIVPGIGVPVGVGRSRGEVGVIFYLSLEHPFGKKRE